MNWPCNPRTGIFQRTRPRDDSSRSVPVGGREVNRVAKQAEFNKMPLLMGGFAAGGSGIQFQVGANMDQNLKVYIGSMAASSLGLQNAQGRQGIITISTADSANQTIGMVDHAIAILSKQRSDLGGYQNRFREAINGVGVAAENMQAANPSSGTRIWPAKWSIT